MRVLAASTLLLLLCAAPAIAEAGGVDVVVDDDGFVIMITVVQTPVATVLKALLDDDETEDEVDNPDLVGRRFLGMDGDCKLFRMTSKGLTGTMTYDYRWCPKPDGLHEDLVKSPDFLHFEVRWRIRSTDAGTEVRYRLKVVPDLKVPGALVRAGQKRSMRGGLERLLARAEAIHAASAAGDEP
jgi:hypothetical protein